MVRQGNSTTVTGPLPALDGTSGAVQLAGVSKVFGRGTSAVHALDHVSLEVAPGEFTCLIGASGCGKSTLLSLVAGLEQPTAGEVSAGGGRVAFLFQEPALFPWLTALRNVAFGLEMSGMDKRAVEARATEVLRIVGLERALHLYPYQLSGGMRHRVAVARAWALKDASVLLMDEPFSAIDAVNRMTLQKYLVDAWLKEPRTVIYVTHDIDEAVYLADRIAIMTPSPGRVGEYVTVDMPRPRDRNSAQANDLRAALTDAMRRLGSH